MVIGEENIVKQIKISRSLVLLAMATFPAFLLDAEISLAAQSKTKQKKPLVVKNASKVVELRNIGQLQEAFERDAGKVRFITILSPT
jgi:hypothetical protein